MTGLPLQLVVMGVSGSGKTTVGTRIAAALSLPFVDADDLHPVANVKTMASGLPLTESDRRPWLAEVGVTLRDHQDAGIVIACSALRRLYRDIIRWNAPRAVFLHLSGPPALVAHRVEDRAGHFMPPALLGSQFELLEPLDADEAGIELAIDADVDSIVREALRKVTGLERERSRA